MASETANLQQIDGSDKEKLAAWLVRAQVRKDLEQLARENKLSDLDPNLVDLSAEKILNGLPATQDEPSTVYNKSTLKVGIIGAGIAGLYAAHILNFLGIPFEILEANPERVGGRLYTHRFSDAEHDYYDIGAMRYPDSDVMFRTFRLFKEAGISDRLMPYHMSGPNQPTRYNDITKILYNAPNDDNRKKIIDKEELRKAREKLEEAALEKARDVERLDDAQWAKKNHGIEPDPFKVSIKNKGPVPDRTVRDPSVILDNAYDYYRNKIKRDPDSGFRYLISHDQFSLRDYLAFVEDQDPETIEWLETLNSATGWFGQAFTENVMESLAFDYEQGNTIKWWCINGGTQKLIEGMKALPLSKSLQSKPSDTLKDKIELGKEVTAVSFDESEKTELKMKVWVRGEDPLKPRKYATVFNTTTMAALQQFDLTGLNLPYASKTAIRTLHYDTSTKVGIRFKTKWWMDPKVGININEAGLGKTDLPLRVCVYPSYNTNNEVDPVDKPAVLLVSYSWGQDSERVASLVDNGPLESERPLTDWKSYEKLPNQERLKALMFDNLARLHTVTTDDPKKDKKRYEELLKIITESYDTHHAYDWSKDPFSKSAFALFGPGDFRKLYSTLVRPLADSRFHIVGEASSAHHAWIVGALDSALRGVHLFLERFGFHDLQQQIKDAKLEGYKDPGDDVKRTVPRFGTTGEIDYETVHLQVALGMLSSLGVQHAAG